MIFFFPVQEVFEEFAAVAAESGSTGELGDGVAQEDAVPPSLMSRAWSGASSVASYVSAGMGNVLDPVVKRVIGEELASKLGGIRTMVMDLLEQCSRIPALVANLRPMDLPRGISARAREIFGGLLELNPLRKLNLSPLVNTMRNFFAGVVNAISVCFLAISEISKTQKNKSIWVSLFLR